jgi:hypothetical protein
MMQDAGYWMLDTGCVSKSMNRSVGLNNDFMNFMNFTNFINLIRKS